VPTGPRVLEFDVTVADDGTARSGLGGSPIPAEDAWLAEHLVLAGLVRCTLASLDHHVREAGLAATGSGSAHGVITRREDDGLYGFVEIEASFAVDLEPALGTDDVRELIEKAERGCFVANSLRVRPRYSWTFNGEEMA
jgi:organic hydroperoxide reductase OsmC/OhrA